MEEIEQNQNEELTEEKEPKKEEKALVLDFYKVIFIYLMGGLVGTLWETLFNFIKVGQFVYCNGTIFTPFNFVYGIGAVAISVFLRNFKKVWQVFLVGTLVGGVTEYTLSFLEEKIIGGRSWDYSNEFLNINGRITIPFCLFWGLLCVIVIFLLYKPILRFTEKFPQKIFHIVMIVLLVIVVIDMIFSLGAIFRYAQRAQGIPANDPLSQFFDAQFDDEFMKIRFPSMDFSAK